MKHWIRLLCLSLLSIVVGAASAQNVAKIGDTEYAALQEAVTAATEGQTIEVLVAGDYTLPGLPKNITVEGAVDGVVFNHKTAAGNVASIPNGATFKNVAFNFGNFDYHGFQHAGTINMEGCTLNGRLTSYGDMNFTNCSFNQSNSDYHMWAYSGNLTYTGCTFTNSVTGKFLNVYNESGATKYTVTVSNCTFINNASSANKAALNVKATSGSNLLAYDVFINNCETEGAFPEASSSDALVVLNSLAQVDDRTASGVDNITVTHDGVLIYPATVAKIGDVAYPTLQSAVDAAQQIGGAVTVNIIDDISGETVTIKEVANFKLTIDGQKDASSNYTVDAVIVVDGLRGNGGSTTNGASVTLQNIAFVKTTATDGIQASHYPHHLTIQDCTYSGSDNDKWFLNASVDGPLYGVTVKDVTVEHARLIYANMADDAVFQNITATNDVKVGFNVKTSGTALIENSQVTTGKYAFRDYTDTYEGTFTLKDNIFISTSEASDEGVIVNRGGTVGTAHVNVESGTYTGHIKVLNNKEGVLAISGGYFSEEFPQEYIAADLVAQGKVCAPATDKEGYFTIGDPHYVAQIGETKYVSLQAALDAAHEMTGDVTITLLDDISNYSIVHQKAGLNLTIDGADKKVTSNIIVDGDGRGTGTETLTIQDIKFEGDGTDFCSGTSSFVEVPSCKTEGTPYYTNKYNYAHNITVTNCSFTSTTSGLTMAAIRSNSGAGAYNVVISDCTGANLHSLAQLTGTTGGSITGNTVSGSESFVNLNGGAGDFTISGNTFTSAEGADGYGIRENGSSTAVITLTDNTFTATNAVVLGKGSSVTAGTINVISGTYVGDITKTDAATGKIVITDGHFSAPLADPAYAEFIAEGLCGVNGLYPDDTAAPNGIGTAVATVTNGTTVISYASLEAAFAAAVDGSTITLLKSTSGNGIVAPQGKFNTNGLTVDFGGFTYTVDGATVGSTGTKTQAFQLLKDNKITFKNGTIYSEKALMLVQNYSDLTLQGMTLDGSALVGSGRYTLSNNNGNVVVENSTITAKAGEGNYAFDVCRYADYPSVSVTVKGESVINGDVEVSASNGDAKDGFNLMFEAGTLNGKIVLDATAETAMAATPEKAKVSKSNALTAIAAPTDYKWVDNGDETSTLAPCVYVAQIGETKYETLTAAVAAAQTGQTIELLADITTETGNKSLKEGVTLDGKGKTISGDIAIYISKKGGTIQNVNFKNIHNATKTKSAVYSEKLEGTATITDCTFDNCDWDAIQITPVAGANVVITNNTFSDDTEDGITQKRYIHVQSSENVDFSATITGNVMLGNNGGPMDVYYPTDKSKVNLANNYIETVDDVLCILVANDDGFAGELAFPAYTTADKEETYSPEAYVQNDQYSAKFYMTFAEAATAAGNEKVVSLVTNVTDPYVMSEGQTLKVKKNGKTFNKPKGPDGFEVKDKTTDGVTTYTLVEADIEYTTLAGVVSYKAWSNTVVSGSGTYKLLKDITASARIVPGSMASNVTIDLNGHTLTSTATDCAILLSRNGSSSSPQIFNLIDTSDEKGGILKVNPEANLAIQVSGKYNDVTIGEGVTIDGNCVALLSENQTLTVNGTINGGNDFAVATNGSTTKNATININEGAVLTSNVTAMYLPGTGTTTISGGSITGTNGIYVKSGELNITGGEITGNGEAAEFVHNANGTSIVGAALVVENCSYPGGAPTVNVSGGTFTSVNADAIASYSYGDGNEPIGQFVHGGYFSTELDRDICEEGKKTVPSTVKEGYYELGDIIYVAQIGEGDAAVKYESFEDAWNAVNDGETITLLKDCEGNGLIAPQGKFTNGVTVDFNTFTYSVTGTLVGSTGTESQAFQLLKDNNISFKNGTIYSEKALFLVQNYSNLTLEGMTLTLNNENYAYGYTLSNNNGNVVIDGTTINANPAGAFAFDVCRNASYPSVSVTVKGESVINGDVEVSASGSDAKNGFYLMLDSGTINGDLVIDATAAAAMEATPDKAVIREKDSFGQAAPADFKWVSDGEGTGTSTLKAREYIAAIGTTKYETLQEAVDAAGTSATTITLLTEAATNGVISGDGVVVPSGSNITFDLNGLTYDVAGETVGSSGTETNGFQLLQGSDITFKNGALKATAPTAQMLIQNYSNLTLEDVNLDGTGLSGWAYALSNNCGTINLTGSTSITAKTGGRAFDTCKFGSYAIPTVNINTTGAITGPIEATGGKLNIQNGKFNVTWVTDSNYSDGDIQIKGGIFSEEPAEEYLVEGYVTTENEDDETKAAYPYAVMTKEDAGIYDLYDLLASNTTHVPQKTIYTLEEDTPVKVVTYYREFSTTTANTRQCWMVPFDYTLTAEDLEKCTFYRVHMFSAPANQEGVVEDENEVVMKIAELTAGYTLKANKPYIIKPKAKGVYEFVAENTTLKAKNTESMLTLSTSINDYDFYGVYDSYGPMAANQWFSLNTNGMLKWNAENQKLGPYRWYIKPTFTGDDYANIAFVIDEEAEVDETTTIDRLIYDPNAEIEGFYTVGGVKLDKPVRGLNIVKYTDGRTKKVYVK